MSGKPFNRRFSGDLPDRLHRLLACGLCRRVPALADDPDLLRAVETAEAFADGRATADDLGRARERAWAIMDAQPPQTNLYWLAWAVDMTAAVSAPTGRDPWTIEPFTAGTVSRNVCILLGLDVAAERTAGTVYPPLFDDVEPRPVAFAPAWRTGTVLALARLMYESREFSAMPILADALQDTGCDSAEILDHCRGPGPHIRGCWVVDLVLGKG